MHRHITLTTLGCLCLVLAPGCSSTMPDPSPGAVSTVLCQQALSVLQDAVHQETEWVKVHAAEGMLWSGHAEGVAMTFQKELESAQPPYRVGVLRVLAQEACRDKAAQKEYMDKILAIFHDKDAADRLHALETLAKLGYAQRTDQVLEAAEPDAGRFQVYARWVLANSGEPADQAKLAELITCDDPALRTGAAYALRHLKTLAPVALDAIETAAADQPDDIYLQSAWFVHCPPARRAAARESLLTFLNSEKKHERSELCLALGHAGGNRDTPLLAKLLRSDPESDVRVYAAFALLRLDQRAQGK